MGERLKHSLQALPSDVWTGIGNIRLITTMSEDGTRQREGHVKMASSRLRDLHRAKLGRATGHCFLKADQATAISLLAGLGVHDPPTQRALYNFPLRSPFTLATAACDGAVQNKTAPDQCGSHRARCQ